MERSVKLGTDEALLTQYQALERSSLSRALAAKTYRVRKSYLQIASGWAELATLLGESLGRSTWHLEIGPFTD